MQLVDVLAGVLLAEGVEVVASVPDEITIFAAEAMRQRGITVVRPRHEQNAVLAADGYSRATGRVGVAMIGPGPALAQTGTALTTASRKGSRVLVLTSRPPDDRPGRQLKEFDARRFVESTGCSYLEVLDGPALLEELGRSFHHLEANLGPLVVALPSRDVLLSETDVSPESLPRSHPIRSHVLDPSSTGVEEVAAALLNARRPLFFVGRGAVLAGARDAIVSLAERTGALLSTSLQAREYFTGHPSSVGVLGTFASEAVSSLLSDADCVVVFGASLNPFQTGGGRLAPGARIVQVDVDPRQLGRFSPIDLGIVGDVAAMASAIEIALERVGGPPSAGWMDSPFQDHVRAAVATPVTSPRSPRSEKGRSLTTRSAMAALDEVIPDDRFVILDAGSFMYPTVDGIRVLGPESWIWSVDFGSIGLGLGMAIGAAVGIAGTTKCVLFVGDGGLSMNLQELETVSREAVDLSIVVLNNSAYGSETAFLEKYGRSPDLSLFPLVDFAAVARALGIASVTVTSLEQIDELTALFDAEGPSLIDIRVPLDVDERAGPGSQIGARHG